MYLMGYDHPLHDQMVACDKEILSVLRKHAQLHLIITSSILPPKTEPSYIIIVLTLKDCLVT